MSPQACGRLRYAVVGTGARAEMFVRALVRDHPGTTELVAFADVNQARMDAHNRWLVESGHPPVPTYRAADFTAMLTKERVGVVLVTSVDVTHDGYIVAALEAGCDVVTEKPMTVDAVRCERILAAVARTGRRVTVAFNYRYNPLHEQVRRLLAEGAVGEVGSVHFEWLLDVRHGADYFRRWHRDKAASGGLMVHKASHHFDLVNWWLGARPVEVFGAGRLFFYGESGRRHGYARDYDRAHGSPAAGDDPFALRLAAHPRLRELYLDAEAEDGYQRDRNVFAPGITIEDDMAVLARYSTGATMTYHLTAYAPWEGYRVMVNGSHGRLELEVTESAYVSPEAAGAPKGAALHGAQAPAEAGGATLTLRPFWAPPRAVTVEGHTRQGHGGADARMTRVLFGGAPDPLDRAATAHDGALALLTGLAANRSFDTGRPVRVADLLTLP
ncbi:Gfo/Idh/MocA family oxidoreductase [Micromonospora echinaurantiaca]|uniref:Gfo/Idh/MocA family oxidoreductase n=1 Tax=Micromonospora echinaurantiaca TaxID=47857 RepID=UPI00343C65CE